MTLGKWVPHPLKDSWECCKDEHIKVQTALLMMSVLWSASKRLFFRQLQNRPFSPVSLPTSNNQARRSLSPPSGHQSHYTTQANLTQPLLEKRQGNGFLKKEAKEAGKGNVRYSCHLHPLKFGFQDPAAPNCPLRKALTPVHQMIFFFGSLIGNFILLVFKNLFTRWVKCRERWVER